MKFMKVLILLTLMTSVFLLGSCTDDNSTNNNIALKLLPQKITIEYEASNKRIYTYKYDDLNRLTGYTETNFFGNSIDLEDMETICKITYNAENKIDSLIIMPRLLNDDNINSLAYLPVNDTITFKHKADKITIKRKNKKNETITINPEGEAIEYKYYGGAKNNLLITNTYVYDHKGNISDISISTGTNTPYSPYKYIYDNKNGIFNQVNTPQWFLLIMLNQDLNYVNNFKEYTDYEGSKWIVKHAYNEYNYPVFTKIENQEAGQILDSGAPTTIDYISGK